MGMRHVDYEQRCSMSCTVLLSLRLPFLLFLRMQAAIAAACAAAVLREVDWTVVIELTLQCKFH